jgi:protein SCO1/2
LQLAAAKHLHLVFQLGAIDYTGRNMVHADDTHEEFARMQYERGENLLTLFARAMQAQMSDPANHVALRCTFAGWWCNEEKERLLGELQGENDLRKRKAIIDRIQTVFYDDVGSVKLGDYFGSKPVVMTFVYYQCPMLCPLTLNGISSALKALSFTPGQDFEIVVVSFDPRDTPEAANAKKQAHLAHWNTKATAAGWHFLTADAETIKTITSAAGFTYQWDEKTGQFAHVSGVLTLTPDGKLSRYFYGVEYSPKELRLALVESGQGRIGSKVDELLLYCFHYDPTVGKYGWAVMTLVRLGGALTVALIVGFVLVMRRREGRAPVERHA